MARSAVVIVCGVGWLVLAAGVLAPLGGMVWAGIDRGGIPTAAVGVPPGWVLLVRSITLSAVATAGAVGLGLLPAAVLGSSRGRAAPVLLGLVLAPLLVPPQVYAYAWELLAAPTGSPGGLVPAGSSWTWLGAAVRAGLISAAWLWPVVALILAAGWRVAGRTAYILALLDTSGLRAFLRAGVPSLRPHLIAAAGLVFAISLLEYAIPHLALSRVYATELLVLVDVGAPAGQIMGMAVQVIGIVLALVALAVFALRSTASWQPLAADDELAVGMGPSQRFGIGSATWPVRAGSAAIWLATVALPVGIMLASLRVPGAWREAVGLFAREWAASLTVSLSAAVMAVVLSVATVLAGQATTRGWLRLGARAGLLATLLAAAMPPAALGIGFVTIYNGLEAVRPVYTDTPVVWSLSLVGRYGAVAALITWLAVGRRGITAAQQAQTDGAGGADVVAFVLLPMVAPSLLAAGLIVAVLGLFEVVVTQLVGPVGFPSIAMTILGHMHYGRDDVVIITSLAVVAAGIILTQICGRLLVRREG